MTRMNTALFTFFMIAATLGCATAPQRTDARIAPKTLGEISKDGTMPQGTVFQLAAKFPLRTVFANGEREACNVSNAFGDLTESQPASDIQAENVLKQAFGLSDEGFAALPSHRNWWPSAKGESAFSIVCIAVSANDARAREKLNSLPGRHTPLEYVASNEIPAKMSPKPAPSPVATETETPPQTTAEEERPNSEVFRYDDCICSKGEAGANQKQQAATAAAAKILKALEGRGISPFGGDPGNLIGNADKLKWGKSENGVEALVCVSPATIRLHLAVANN